MILQKNCFPIWVIGKIIHSSVSRKMNVNPPNMWTGPLSSCGTSTHFYKLSNVGHSSKVLALIKLTQLLKRYCKTDLDIKIVSALKVSKKFSVKDSMPQSLCLRVVYKVTCADCNAFHIHRTTHPICTRASSVLNSLFS